VKRAAILCLVLTWIAPRAWGEEVKPSHKEAAAELLERLMPRMIDIYVEAYTEQELRELIAFYKTPAGKKTLEKMPLLMPQGTRELLGASKTNPKPGPEDPLQRGNRLYDEKKWAEARDSYLLHLKTNPQDSSARSDLGVCYKELGAPEKALEEFDRILTADPGHWQALYNKINVLGFDLDRKAEAVALLPTLRQLRPDDEAVEVLAAALDNK
jgi:tetratricopeptide (TPR) repeat protein